jgi:tetratricopeptide (TPR) repeat protein
VNTLLKKAADYKKDKDYQKAIETLDKVLALDPGNPDAWTEGAWIFNEQGKYDIAIKAADKALDTDPDHSGALREKGYALMKQGKNKEGGKLLYQAIEQNKRNWAAYDYLAEALDNLGERKLAKDLRAAKKAEHANDDR